MQSIAIQQLSWADKGRAYLCHFEDLTRQTGQRHAELPVGGQHQKPPRHRVCAPAQATAATLHACDQTAQSPAAKLIPNPMPLWRLLHTTNLRMRRQAQT